MNKGMKLSGKEWKIFINSDDLLYNPNSLNLSLTDVNCDSVAGRAINIGNRLNWLRPKFKSVNIRKYSHQAFISRGKLCLI